MSGRPFGHDGSPSGGDSPLRRRPVLQAIGGAAGILGLGATSAAADEEGEDRGRGRGRGRGGGSAPLPPNREIPTSSQFFSWLTMTVPGPTNTNAHRLRKGYTEGWFTDESEGYSNADLIRLSADAGLDSYEPFMLDDEEAMLAAQEETGCYMSSAHVSTGDVESDPEGTAETYAQFAHDGRNPPLVEPIIDSGWDSEEGARENARRVNEAADLMAEQGFKFGYHNHDHEFQYVDEEEERRAYDVFIEHLDEKVYVQLDVAWVYAGVDAPDPIHYITEYGDKIESLHMKNYTYEDEELTEVHLGDLEMEEIAQAARDHAAVDHFVYEYDQTPHPHHSFQYASLVLNRFSTPCYPDKP